MCQLCDDDQLEAFELTIDGCLSLTEIKSEHLVKLTLKNLPNLVTIRTGCFRIFELSIVNCPRLKIIESIPWLSRLSVKHCARLTFPYELKRLTTLNIDGVIAIKESLSDYNLPSLSNLAIFNYTNPLSIGGYDVKGEMYNPSLSNIALNGCCDIHLHGLKLSSLISINSELLLWESLTEIMKPTAFLMVKKSHNLFSLKNVNVVTVFIEDCPNLYLLPESLKHLKSFQCPKIERSLVREAVLIEIDGTIIHSI